MVVGGCGIDTGDEDDNEDTVAGKEAGTGSDDEVSARDGGEAAFADFSTSTSASESGTDVASEGATSAESSEGVDELAGGSGSNSTLDCPQCGQAHSRDNAASRFRSAMGTSIPPTPIAPSPFTGKND